MKGTLDEHTVGLVVGATAGLWHLVWAILVFLGFAQALLDWIYGIHFLDNPFTVGNFELGRAVVLVVVTSIVGYVAGWVFSAIWNTMIGKKK